MKSVTLDYARARYSNRHMFSFLLLFLSISFLAFQLTYYVRLSAEVERATADLNSQQLKLQASQEVQPSSDTIPPELTVGLEDARKVITQLSLPWNELFEAIESVENPDIAVLQIQPSAEQKLVRITAEARASSDIERYINALNKTESLGNVRMISHQLKTDDPQKPLVFTIIANWEFD